MTSIAHITPAPPSAELLAAATRPVAPLTLVYAGVLARFGTLALPMSQLQPLFDSHFPRASALLPRFDGELPAQLRCRFDEVEDVRDLLYEHRSSDSNDSRWLAHAMAVGCLGSDHLWQDLGLPERRALSQLLQEHFTTLHARNGNNMRWKKFFYKQLCERAELHICKAPSCAECIDYPLCFSAEAESA